MVDLGGMDCDGEYIQPWDRNVLYARRMLDNVKRQEVLGAAWKKVNVQNEGGTITTKISNEDPIPVSKLKDTQPTDHLYGSLGLVFNRSRTQTKISSGSNNVEVSNTMAGNTMEKTLQSRSRAGSLSSLSPKSPCRTHEDNQNWAGGGNLAGENVRI